MKPKLTIDEQIEHMDKKGVTFDLRTNKVGAMKFISDNTYYFKIKAYTKNFPKNNLGRYVNLDFEMLKELSTLDMHLRKTILQISLNLEHAIKIFINKHLCDNAKEDGYDIVKNFIIFRLNNSLNLKKSKYTQELYDKYDSNFAVWNLLELLTLGDLISFYAYYFDKYCPNLSKIKHSLFAVSQLRNATAHNNCLLINLTTSQISPTLTIKHLLKGRGISDLELENKLSIIILNDFANLLYCFVYFVKSSSVKEYTIIELNNLTNRINRHIEYFDKHQKIKNNLTFFEKMVDILK